MKKRTRIIISAMLSLVILLGCIPASIFSTSALEVEPEILPTETKITEIEEYRGENEKHFSLPDGTIEAVAYPQAVHRLDSNGEWQDIDNDLSLKTVGTSQLYTTDDSRVSFALGYTRNSTLVTLQENGYTISMSLLDNGNEHISTETLSFTHIDNAEQVRPESFDTLEEATNIDNKASISYSDVMNNTNIEYILSGNDLKENIVVKAKRDSYEYSFLLALDGLTAELRESGEIYLIDETTEEMEYIIPAPYMYDSNNSYSDSVSYELIHAGGDKYLLTVIADPEWINEDGRAFPVRIDPTIKGSAAPDDTYINSSSPSTNYVSANPLVLSSTTAVLIKPNLPVIPFFATLNYATLYIRYYPPTATTSSMSIRAKSITSTWSAGSVTYNTKPSVSSSNLATATLTGSSYTTSTSPGYANFRITSAVTNHYSTGASFYGVALDRTSGASTFYIKSSESGSSFYPYVSVNYTGDKNICRVSNPASGNYLGIDDYQNANYQSSGADIEVSAWDSSKAHQLWYFIFVGEGYYKIISVDSYLAISVQSGYESSSAKPLVQQNYTGSDNQLWSVTKTTLGTCIIRPKSRPAWCMAEGISSLSSGKVGQTAYTDDVNYYDEWILDGSGVASLSTPLIAQQTPSWCWAAASRMFAENYSSVPSSRDQAQAVATAFPTLEEEELEKQGGSGNAAQIAINYYLGINIDWLDNGDVDPACLHTTYHKYLVYDKSTIVDFIEDQQVLYINRVSVFEEINDGLHKCGVGHASVIYGYITIGSETYFLIRDPDPPVNNSANVAPGTTKLMTHQQIYHRKYYDNGGNELVYEHLDEQTNTNKLCHIREYWVSVIAKNESVSSSYINNTTNISSEFPMDYVSEDE